MSPAVVELTHNELKNHLEHMINLGQSFEAFQKVTDVFHFSHLCIFIILVLTQVLSMNGQSMVMFVCSKVNLTNLFAVKPCVFPPHMLLSLIKQISADLGTSTALKLG